MINDFVYVERFLPSLSVLSLDSVCTFLSSLHIMCMVHICVGTLLAVILPSNVLLLLTSIFSFARTYTTHMQAGTYASTTHTFIYYSWLPWWMFTWILDILCLIAHPQVWQSKHKTIKQQNCKCKSPKVKLQKMSGVQKVKNPNIACAKNGKGQEHNVTGARGQRANYLTIKKSKGQLKYQVWTGQSINRGSSQLWTVGSTFKGPSSY